MKGIFNSILLGLILLWTPMNLSAQISVPNVFSDNCVLQHNTKVKIWGHASKNVTVTVTGSWNNEAVQTQSDNEGKWLVELNTINPSYTPYTITISQPNDGAYTIHNVLIGEVWICSGQSNMEMPVRGWLPDCPIKHSESLIQQSGRFHVNCLMVKEERAGSPREECHGDWKVASPENTPYFSATAYTFAMYRSGWTGRPIGILVTCWGGTNIDTWLSPEYTKKYDNVNHNPQDKWNNGTGSLLYNAMIYPIKNYTAYGFLWYQGEANVGDKYYADKMKDLITSWRKDWGNDSMPFYFVEIAPFNYGNTDQTAKLREQQMKAALESTNTGMICTNDLVSPDEPSYNIHPGDKLGIGRRLATMSMVDTWKDSDPWGPMYQSMKVNGNKAILSFSHNEKGFIANPNITGFEVAGSDKVFHPATAEIVNDTQVEVTSPKVDKVIAVRYCFGDAILGNLLSKSRLPVYPFRTDKW